MEVVKLKNISFYTKYKNARQIIDLGGGHQGGNNPPAPPKDDSNKGDVTPATNGNNSGVTESVAK